MLESEAQLGARLGPYFLVAEVDGQVVGFVSGSTHESDGAAVVPEGVVYLEVADLYVAAPSRRGGIGGRLLDELLAVARREGVRKVLVYSATKDVRRVLTFYERQGFRPWYVQMFRDL